MKTTTSERLREIMATKGLRQVDILERCKPYCERYGVEIRRGDLSQYVSGRVKPNQYRLTILSLALGVSEPYLMGYNEDECNNTDELLNNYNKLTPTNKNVVINLINNLLEGQNK